MLLKLNPVRLLSKIFPIVTWSRSYDTELAVSDLVAGITIALTLIPQSIAYASLAGLDPQYGLYSSFAGSLVYIVFGTVPEISIGPTALLSLLTFTYTTDTNPDFAVLLCFLGGFIQLLVGFSRLGFLVDFVSIPVVSGFTSAAALIIACSQIKGLLGLSFKAETFLDIWKAVGENISHVRQGDAILSVICCTILLGMRKLKDLELKPKKGEELEASRKRLQRIIWFISVSRNAAVVIGCAVAAYVLDTYGSNALKLTGNIVSGLPPFGLPNFNTTVGNDTFTFSEMAKHLGSGIIVVPLIGIIANVAIAKAFSKGKVLDANREVVALGIANVISSLVQSIPVNGSFARSAVSNASGVRTPAAGLYTGIIVLMTLGFLTPYFYFIPKAALASVIICAVIFMIDLNIILDLWKKSRLDLISLFGTFVACLFLGVEIGILIGIAIDVVFLLYYNARPRLHVKTITVNEDIQYTIVTPTGGLFFPSANYVREKMTTVGSSLALDNVESSFANKILVIDCQHFYRTDWTSLQGIKSILSDFKNMEKGIIFLNCRASMKEKLETEMKEKFIHCPSEEDLKNLLNGTVRNEHLSKWLPKQENNTCHISHVTIINDASTSL